MSSCIKIYSNLPIHSYIVKGCFALEVNTSFYKGYEEIVGKWEYIQNSQSEGVNNILQTIFLHTNYIEENLVKKNELAPYFCELEFTTLDSELEVEFIFLTTDRFRKLFQVVSLVIGNKLYLTKVGTLIDEVNNK